jgi:hypothetical protein
MMYLHSFTFCCIFKLLCRWKAFSIIFFALPSSDRDMSGPGSGGMGAGGGGGSNPGQVTTTSSSTQTTHTNTGFMTLITASSLVTATSQSSSPTSTSTAASSSGSNKYAIIGGVVGAVGGLLLLSLIAGYFIRKRLIQKPTEKDHEMPVAYRGMEASFSHSPLSHSSVPGDRDNLFPAPLFTHSTNTSHSGVGTRGDETTFDQNFEIPSLGSMQPTYAESASTTHALNRQGTLHAPSEGDVSPLSSRDPGEVHTISPQVTGATIPFFLVPHGTGDTMGFPIDEDAQIIRIQSETPTPIVAPVPVHPLIHQDSLERAVRHGLQSETPAPDAGNPNRLRVLSQVIARESPILGDMNPVRMYQPPASSEGDSGSGRNISQRQPPLSHSGNSGLRRNVSQRTVDSMISVISDGELERLGVGSSARQDTI